MSNCKVIALTNQKGGIGKTTTAVNLGVGLARQGSKVLLIDADAQANLTMALGYNRPDDIPVTLPTIMQDIIDDKPPDVSQGIIHNSEGVDLLPSNIELSGFEVRLINAMSRERVLKTYVNAVKKDYDYVLIDCMPSLGMITINALKTGNTLKKASSDTWNALSANQKKAVGLALLYGYQGNKNNLSGSDDEKWLATQTLVWEFVTGCREATGSYKQTSKTVYSLHFGSNYANSGARAAYDQIVSMLTEHNTIPSFMSGGKSDITKELAYKD